MSTWETQWGEGYGSQDYGFACLGVCIATAIAVTAAVGGATVKTVQVVRAARERDRQIRIASLRQKTKAIKKRAAALKKRRREAKGLIAESREQIHAASAETQAPRRGTLYAGAVGLILISIIAARAAKRG
jgi:Flp pilus assembly protein TadB